MVAPFFIILFLPFVSPFGYHDNLEQIHQPACPEDSKPLLDLEGKTRRCLPHQNNLCLEHINVEETDARSVCCWYNQVDYYCCLDVNANHCPSYANVTVVIHKKDFRPPTNNNYYVPNNQVVRQTGRGYGSARNHGYGTRRRR